ncbi:hypothetical protein P879_09949 [Paragonimus westermani]|uniref:Phosphatidylinositol glycan, class U n=1 Tax=Paragonimus westermani TaxID=34504 RepID=A0A8T0CYL9_9TREM|nr:hypothetical protein P879_09949 [Paragonimus westermani]
MRYLTLFVWMVVMLSVRVLVKHCASQNFIKSFAHSSMDNWDSVLEGVFLHEAGLNVYDNDIVHQPPLALHLWSVALRYTKNWVVIYFLLLELVNMYSILKLSDVCISVLISSDQRTQPNVHASSRSLILSRDDFVLCGYLMIMCYCFNPYSILAFASQSTSIIWNITSVWTLITCFQNHLFISSCFCALGCYLRLYSGLLLLPILAVATFKTTANNRLAFRLFRMGTSLLGFVATTVGLLYGSYLAEGRTWTFLKSIYLHHHEPVFLSVAVLLVASVLQPYHSVGEFGCLLAVLPLWSYLYKYCRLALPTICVLLAALVLTPLFYYMWLQPGTANANFYFAACMVYAVGQILLITDWLNAHSKREYLLRVGQELTLSSGQKLVLIQS